MPVKSTVLVIAAHPDDEVLGCGASMAKFAAEGKVVHVAFLADGVGARQGAKFKAELKQRRKAAQSAAKVLGAKSVFFGDFPDNRMDSVNLLDVVQVVEKLIAEYRPAIVLTHHVGDLNIDHRITSQAVVTACRPQKGQSVKQLLFFEVPSSTEWQVPGAAPPFEPNWFVDVSTKLPAKMKALKLYEAEMRPWPHPRSYAAVEHLARWRGAMIGANAAEAFVVGRIIA